MSEPETLPAGVHPESTLLPWYANETLDAEERQRVARHLESCADCRRELDELKQLRQDLTAVYAAQAEPSARLARSVRTTVASEASRRPQTGQSSHWSTALDQWFRSLFLPQWVPTLAAVMLVAQFGLLLWVTTPTEQDQIGTRSISSPTVRFNVVFQDQATQGQIRTLLETIGGRIVDGPSPQGSYVVEVMTADPAIRVKTLETLRARRDIVSGAETTAQ